MKKTKTKSIIAVLIMAVMTMALLIPNVKADGEYTITFTATGTHTVTVDGGHLKIDDGIVDPMVDNNPTVNFTCEDKGNGTVEMKITNGDAVTLNYSGNGYSLVKSGSVMTQDTTISEAASISVINPAVYGNIALNATFNGTEGEISFNNGAARTTEGPSYDGTLENAGYTDNSLNNSITVTTSFGMQPATKITVNGTVYSFDDGLEEHTIDVAGAQSYTIVVQSNSNVVTPKTIIWANPDYVPEDEEDAQWAKDFSIVHGYARAIAVYDENNNKLSPNEYINTGVQPDGSRSDEYGLRDGFGWVRVMPGSRAVFEFVPDYGYQLTSIKLNEQEVDATGVTNQFEIVIPEGGGNVHFAAEFTKTDDIVKAGSDSVEEGTITLPDGSIENGTAQLTVNDVDLPADKVTGFQNAAGDYTISNYLDIDLYQVFYKGKDDSDDVWSNKIDEINDEATISIKLADGLTADDIVIVHNVHDGDEYEVIEIESYDAATNTITFKTKSFSNYAIATKGTGKSKLPKAGDSIVTIMVAIAAAIVGLFVAIKVKKNGKDIK